MQIVVQDMEEFGSNTDMAILLCVITVSVTMRCH
jgi:hypothetical protein